MKILFCLFAVTLVLFAGTAFACANPKINELTVKQQALVPIASDTASGDMEKLKAAINAGLDDGLTVNETKEVMVHLYAYCGFPRALNGLNAVEQVLNERQQKGIKDEVGKEATPVSDNTDILSLGTQVQTKLAGAPVNIAASPAIDRFLKTHLFGDLFARDVLNAEDREIVTISALASMKGTEAQLGAHLRLGHNAGLSFVQLQDIVNVLDSKLDSDLATNAQKVLDAYLAQQK